jgi:hypothetical protein
MATRYWVGGPGIWDTSTTTNWSATSGGSGGASVPTFADTVIINTSSGTDYISCFDGVCNVLSVTATQAIFLSGFLTTYNNVTFPSGGLFSASSLNLTMTSVSGNVTLRQNGKTLNSFTSSSNGFLILSGSGLTVTEGINVTKNTFYTSGFIITCGFFYQTYSGTPITIDFQSSTVTVNNGNFDIGGTGITVLAGSATIILTGSGGAINAASGTSFYEVQLRPTSPNSTQFFNCAGCTITYRLTFAGPFPSTGINTFIVDTSSPINVATFTTFSTIGITQRVFIKSSSPTTPATINLTGSNSIIVYTDLQDINITGTSLSGFNVGDCKNNSGLAATVLTTPKTVYWNLAGAQYWSATGWATSSGGTPNANNFPLAQDTAVFNNLSSSASVTIDYPWNIGTIDTSARSLFGIITVSNNFNLYGNFLFGSGVDLFYSVTFLVINIVGRTTQTITSNGKYFNGGSVNVNSPGGTLTFADDFYISGGALSGIYLGIACGTIDANNRNLTMPGFTTQFSSLTKTITMGSGTWTVYGTSSWEAVDIGSTLTVNANTSTINIANGTASTTTTFNGAGKTYNNINIGSPTVTGATTVINGTNTFNTLSSTKTVAHTITLGANQTFANWTATGTLGNVITLNSSTNGLQRTVTKTGGGTITVYYYNIKDSNGQPANTWFSPGSTNSGNNDGWTFFNAYTDVVTEAITIADSSLVIATFRSSVIERNTLSDIINGLRSTNANITEAVTIADADAGIIVTFVTAISEGLNVDDTPTGFGIYPISISENITLADIEAAVKIHNATAAEPISVLDVTSCFGFGTIDNSQSTTWVLVDNRQ